MNRKFMSRSWTAPVAPRLRIEDLRIDNADVVFDRQDSGCLSFGVAASGHRWFVKTARNERAAESLENCLRFHRAVQHDAIVRPVGWFRAPSLTLVYPWMPGQVLNQATTAGSDRRAMTEFRALQVDAACSAVSTVLDAHRAVARKRFVAVDFYDGSLLYDFPGRAMRLIDLDEYRPGPFVLRAERLPGSTSYMAPEEFERGAVIDERTTVFVLGRMVHHLLAGIDEARWRGTSAQAAIVERATASSPRHRFRSVDELGRAWVESLH